LLTTAPEAKRFGMVRELVPSAALVGVLINPNYQEAEGQSQDLARFSHTTFSQSNNIAQGFFGLPMGKRHRGVYRRASFRNH
jgi:hypothetical protein